MQDQIALAIGVLVFLNTMAFMAFGLDKSWAEKNDWRIPEKNLLMLAFLGGSLGAVAAQRYFRHKTRKQPFSSILMAIAFLHIAVAIVFAVPQFRQLAFEWIAALPR